MTLYAIPDTDNRQYVHMGAAGQNAPAELQWAMSRSRALITALGTVTDVELAKSMSRELEGLTKRIVEYQNQQLFLAAVKHAPAARGARGIMDALNARRADRE
jgi:hypothetical protein